MGEGGVGLGGGEGGGGAAGQMIRLEHDASSVRVAPDRATATVGAGLVLRELAHHLASLGLQLYSAIELGNLTAGIHAVGLETRGLAACRLALCSL